MILSKLLLQYSLKKNFFEESLCICYEGTKRNLICLYNYIPGMIFSSYRLFLFFFYILPGYEVYLVAACIMIMYKGCS